MSHLTTKKIAALKPQNKRYSIAIEGGLTIRVHPSGAKSWLLRIARDGRVKDVTLGHFPDVTLLQAKQLARKKQQSFDLKPIDGYLLKDGFALWCNLKRHNIISYKDEKRRLERYVIAPLGKLPIDEITAPLVIRTVRHIETSGKQATLKRVLMRLREILDLCVYAGYITHNPLSKISKVFAPATVTSMPSTDWRELVDVMKVIGTAPTRLQNYFLFSLCSMLRPGEIAKLEKSWIKDDAIVIPAQHMKKKREHRVPLTSFMKRLIRTELLLSPHPRNKFIFAGRSASSHVSKQALTKWLHTSPLKGKLVAHGLRSVARSWLADHNVDAEVAETCLSHTFGDVVYRTYQRSNLFEARRAVFVRWNSYVESCAVSAGILTVSSSKSANTGDFSNQNSLCQAQP